MKFITESQHAAISNDGNEEEDIVMVNEVEKFMKASDTEE